MTPQELQSLCDQGQRELMRMNYLEAERLLAEAEAVAWSARDWDTLARLYMPLQETRRQRRQHCGEGIVRLDIIARSASDQLNPKRLILEYPFGQLLIAGFATAAPAIEFRRLAARIGIYVETFLAASFSTTDHGLAIAILPCADVNLPPAHPAPFALLQKSLPRYSLLIPAVELPQGPHPGTARTYARVMDLWERLHSPLVAEADAQVDPIAKMEAYRRAIVADYACELAHQRLADTARAVARGTNRVAS